MNRVRSISQYDSVDVRVALLSRLLGPISDGSDVPLSFEEVASLGESIAQRSDLLELELLWRLAECSRTDDSFQQEALAFLRHKTYPRRDAAARYLRRKCQPFFDTLLITMANDNDVGVRYQVALRLVERGDGGGTKMLIEMLPDLSGNHEMWNGALETLCHVATSADCDILQQMATSKKPNVDVYRLALDAVSEYRDAINVNEGGDGSAATQ